MISINLLSITVSQSSIQGLADGQEDSLSREEDGMARLADGIEDSLPRIADCKGRRIDCQGRKLVRPTIARQGKPVPTREGSIPRIAESLAKKSWSNQCKRRGRPRRANPAKQGKCHG